MGTYSPVVSSTDIAVETQYLYAFRVSEAY